MNIISMVLYSLRNLRYRGIRSWLTLLGIVIGITSVVVLVGMVEGLKLDITKQLSSFGTRTFAIVPVSTSSFASGASAFLPTTGKLFEKDAARLKSISSVEYVAKVITGRTFVVYKDKEISALVYGVEPESFSATAGSLEIETGRFLFSSDRRSVVVGADIAENGFDKKIEVGSLVNLSGNNYRVVGILKKTGNSFIQLDNVIAISFQEAKELFNEQLVDNEISTIRLTIHESYDLKEVEDEINSIMLSSHRVTFDEKDFAIITPNFINEQVNSITSLLSVFLGGVAGVSLIVGGIGISNTMFMSVLERKKEIGVIKSLGLSSNQVMHLFLIESAFIGALGGLLGIILSYAVAFIVQFAFNLSFYLSVPLLIFSVLFAGIVGIISGTIPAIDAANLNPVDALRYE